MLDKIVENYNSRPHRSLGKLAPREVNEKNQVTLWNKMYIDSLRPKAKIRRKDMRKTTGNLTQIRREKYIYNKGQLVRISYSKSPFERSYKEKFTQEAFIVRDRYLMNGIPVYKLADLQNTLIDGVFYSHDLQPVIIKALKALEAWASYKE